MLNYYRPRINRIMILDILFYCKCTTIRNYTSSTDDVSTDFFRKTLYLSCFNYDSFLECFFSGGKEPELVEPIPYEFVA